MSKRPKPVVLAILDGWGVAPDSEGNAITRAKKRNMDHWIATYPAMTLIASGNEVGLSWGEMGNSEVGHLNIGAGRVYYQTFPRINKAISEESFFSNEALLEVVEHIKKHSGRLHILGLMSTGNVHAAEEHCYTLLEFAKRQKVRDVFIHAFLDGRDAKFDSGKQFIEELLQKMREYKIGKLASLAGRFYAMDRDNRWDRTEKAYRAIVEGSAEVQAEDPIDAIAKSYEKNIYDEEFVPTVLTENGNPIATVEKGDGIIFFNFRPDRARQLTKAVVLPGFSKFTREYIPDVLMTTMVEYEKDLPVRVAFPPLVVQNCFAEVLSTAGLKQFHVAETEKYAHITFFLNGTIEHEFEGEKRVIVPSPSVSSYDQKPEMAASEIARQTVKAIESGEFDVLLVNFANADMVGHTGKISETIAGVEAVDAALGKIVEVTLAHDGVVLITADHGNAEEIINLHTGAIDKEHSTNPVPFLVIGNAYEGTTGPGGDVIEGDLSLMPPTGMLADVAPTVLKILGISQPSEMTGHPLI